MLGVLAIIAILSVIAIASILYALNKYRANATIYDVSLMAATILTNEDFKNVADEQQITVRELKSMTHTTTGYPITPFRVNSNMFVITIQNVPKRVCRLIIDGPNPTDFYIEVNSVSSKNIGKDVCTTDTNSMNFYFDAYQNSTSCGGEICANGHICVDDTCVCPDDRKEQNGTCVCKDNLDECNGQCYEPCDFSQPGILGTRDPNTCQCLCNQAAGFILDGNQCVCPEGYLIINGTCKRFGCSGGTEAGNDWNCCIGSIAEKCTQTDPDACGQGCTQQGSNCQYGFCSDLCPNETIWGNLGLVSNYGTRNLYGCINKEHKGCYPRENIYTCVDVETITDTVKINCGQHCQVNGTSCLYGDCENRCKIFNEKNNTNLEYTFLSTSLGTYYGCKNPENKIWCVVKEENDHSYQCFNEEEKSCAYGCYADGTDCSENLCLENMCPQGTNYFIPQNGSFRGTPACQFPDGVYCIAYDKIRCLEKTDQFCALNCSGFNLDSCLYGTCQEEDCESKGLSYEYLSNASVFGCRNPQNGVFCSLSPYDVYTCYDINNNLCGQNCKDYFASGCEACFDTFSCPEGWEKTLERKYSFSALENACIKDNTVCLSSSKVCKIKYDQNTYFCGTNCELNGICEYGTCLQEEANCSNGFYFGYVSSAQKFGCINTETGISCIKNQSNYQCYAADLSICGTNCTKDGKSCSSGICVCPEGQELIEGKCTIISTEITCKDSLCQIGNRYCGYGCNEKGEDCQVGSCISSEAACPEKTHFGKVTNEFYGCIHNETYISCYQYGGTYICFKNGSQCGTECNADGTGGTCDVGCI